VIVSIVLYREWLEVGKGLFRPNPKKEKKKKEKRELGEENEDQSK